MKHIVTISIAPVIAVLDDNADPLSLTAVPLSFAFWLPCQLYIWLASPRRSLERVTQRPRRWLSQLGERVRRVALGDPAWMVGTG